MPLADLECWRFRGFARRQTAGRLCEHDRGVHTTTDRAALVHHHLDDRWRADLRWKTGEQIEEMAAGKSGRPRDEDAHRVTPLIAPLNGEKFPRPASVRS